MSKLFSFRVYTAQDISSATVVEKLWRVLDTPLIKPVLFDKAQAPKRAFRSDGAKAAARLAKGGFLFVQGERRAFQASFSPRGDGLHAWNFFVEAEALGAKEQGPWLEWFHGLCSALPVRFASGCTTEEYEAKHQVVERLSPKLLRKSAVGVSSAEFHRYLPGLYWLTVFGAELVAKLGAQRLRKAPGTIVTDLDGGQLSLRLKGPASARDYRARLETESRIAEHLGAEHFFNRNSESPGR